MPFIAQVSLIKRRIVNNNPVVRTIVNPKIVAQELETFPQVDDSLFVHNHTITTWQVSHVAFALSDKQATPSADVFLARLILTGIGGYSQLVGGKPWPDDTRMQDWANGLTVTHVAATKISSEMDRACKDLKEAEELDGRVPDWFTLPSPVVRAWQIVESNCTRRHSVGHTTSYIIELSDHFCFLEIHWES